MITTNGQSYYSNSSPQWRRLTFERQYSRILMFQWHLLLCGLELKTINFLQDSKSSTENRILTATHMHACTRTHTCSTHTYIGTTIIITLRVGISMSLESWHIWITICALTSYSMHSTCIKWCYSLYSYVSSRKNHCTSFVGIQ